MLFNSLSFLYFFLGLLLISFFSPQSWLKNIVLIASLYFYAFWYPPYLLLLLISVLIDYYAAIFIQNSSSQRYRKFYLWISIVLNLVILFSFKYLAFAVSTFGFSLSESFNWALPLGISFFTFQTMAYSIDVYRKEVEAKKSFRDFLLYICFFPQLIAGPILRLKESWQELTNPLKPDWKSINDGLYLILWGLMKKMVIADNLAKLVEANFSENIPGTALAWLGIYAFAIQIYCDFSGYVDCALGIGKIFKVKLPENFNFPYLSKSITEFWHRWHITLSSWLKDYLYIPLGGNRKGEIKRYRNLIITMLLGGLWHGANWTFLVWGGIHGLLLAIEKFIMENFPKSWKFISENCFGRVFLWLITFHLLCLAWVYFRSEDTVHANQYLLSMLLGRVGDSIKDVFLTNTFYIFLIFISTAFHLINRFWDLKNSVSKWNLEFRAAFLVFSIILILVLGVHQEARFIYFDF